MEASIYKLNPKKIKALDVECLKEGTFIWVLHADKIPPHIGISHNGLYYSLKANGRDFALPFKEVIQVIKRKQIASLFVEVLNENEQNLFDFFIENKNIIISKSTCLTPLIKYLLKVDEPLILVELLDKLSKEQRIKTIFGLHLKADFDGIPNYDHLDIKKRIQDIQYVKRSKHFSKSN